MMSQPLTTCIMPTYNRRAFLPRAIAYFLRQDYPNKELLILDDGTDPIGDLVPPDERIRYIRLESRATVGAKRNMACEEARGEIIAHWDDDDWYAPRRLSYQVERLLSTGADLCGLSTLLFYEMDTGKAWRYTYPQSSPAWLSGSTQCYRRAFWQRNRFDNINVGEDTRFVWSRAHKQVERLPDHTIYVGMLHSANVCSKHSDNAYWQPHDTEEIAGLLGHDLWFYGGNKGGNKSENKGDSPTMLPSLSVAPPSYHSEEIASVSPVRNVFACLVHESFECALDLVRNLRCLDPTSTILLYDGSKERLFDRPFPFERYGVVRHPAPRPQSWGSLHTFALDCMQFALDNFEFDTLTIVDSDQLGARPGYSRYLAQFLAANPGVGLLGNSPGPQPLDTKVGPALAAYREIELWRPWLRRFPDGERKFVHWSFWPSTVFTADAARALTRLFASDEQLQELMRRTKIWATEEVIFPTLVELLGYRVAANPCSYDYVKYRQPYSQSQIDSALGRPEVYWLHPIERRYDHAGRKQVRLRHAHYQTPIKAAAHAECAERDGTAKAVADPCSASPMLVSVQGQKAPLLLTYPILKLVSGVEGWLEEEEADLLIEVGRLALSTQPQVQSFLEVGSYCGRATVALGSVMRALCPQGKVYSIDRHDGRVGALDQGLESRPPTYDKLISNLAKASLTGVVEVLQADPQAVAWSRSVSLLLIDGLHDYANVAGDFFHFERWVVPGGYIAFHDYADYYPGVKAFVGELLASGEYAQLWCVRSMVALKKLR